MADYKYLFTPLKLGPITLKNRIVWSGHTHKCWEPVTFLVGDRAKGYYEERARGGVGGVVLGMASVDEKADYWPLFGLPLWTDDVIPGLKELTDILHKYDCKVFAEPGHPGIESVPFNQPDEVMYDVSQHSALLTVGEMTKELTREEIWQIEDKFASAAERVKKAGVDGIELLHGHGKLFWRFFYANLNKRTDEYGGSLENRMRFAREVIDKVRQAVGKDFCVGMRFEAVPTEIGGINVEESVEAAKMYEATGQLDYMATVVGALEGIMGTPTIEMNPYYANFEPGWEGEFSRKIKAAVKLPVSAASKINDPGLADRMIADGQVDYVYICRALIADPHFAKKAMEGREEDIRPCMYCNQGCIGRGALEAGNFTGLRCTVNPTAGDELHWGSWTFKKSPRRKKILVIGAGPAGLQCAMASTERGHDVVIYDKENELGGQARLIKKLPGQTMPQTFLDYLELQLQKLRVKVNLGVEITSENIDGMLAKEKPEVVVVATGARPSKGGESSITFDSPIPGWEQENVYTYEDVLLGKAKLGDRILILDHFSDRVAPGIAELLADQGKKVEIITARSSITEPYLTLWGDSFFMMPRLYELGVKITPFTWVKQITEKGVICFNVFSQGEGEYDVEADNLIMVTMKYSNTELYELLKQRGVEYYLIGDAKAPRWIWNATHDGYKVATEI
jgi:2,4-dienoyl-CoA reductase-like NADH-dependent reductase (Old Yellow Enzyme family)